jgi:transcriptional regulator with GAF, ATPase, and Fis domain
VRSCDRASGMTDDETLPLQSVLSVPLPVVVRVVGSSASHVLRPGATCTVGSADGADLVIASPTVSRAHAELTLVPEGVRVRDVGSRNGTFYLGQRIVEAVLAPSATIRLGSVDVSFAVDAGGLASLPEYAQPAYRGVLGPSGAMRRLFAVLVRLEGSLAPVLLEGESGVGKEVVAKAIHDGSGVAGGPFVAVNCGALPRDLVASELFGHKKGAFTGATESRRGLFDAADGGTLFLDEIGELPLELQPHLLRVLETGEVRPVGSDAGHRVKVRIVAATNRDVDEEVRAGRFREDLLYRLGVVRLRIPPLRERLEDIATLAAHFAGDQELPSAVLEALRARDFPGNVRELRNAVQAWAALGVLPEPRRSSVATLELALGEMVDPRAPYAPQKEAIVDRFTAIYLRRLLADAGGSQTAAARIADLDRGYLGRLLVKYGIKHG